MKRLTQDEFIEGSVTLGVEFNAYQAKIEDSYLKMQIWDTAGGDQFRSLTPIYYKGAAAVVLCYDSTSSDSFESLSYWVDELS